MISEAKPEASAIRAGSCWRYSSMGSMCQANRLPPVGDLIEKGVFWPHRKPKLSGTARSLNYVI